MQGPSAAAVRRVHASSIVKWWCVCACELLQVCVLAPRDPPTTIKQHCCFCCILSTSVSPTKQTTTGVAAARLQPRGCSAAGPHRAQPRSRCSSRRGARRSRRRKRQQQQQLHACHAQRSSRCRRTTQQPGLRARGAVGSSRRRRRMRWQGQLQGPAAACRPVQAGRGVHWGAAQPLEGATGVCVVLCCSGVCGCMLASTQQRSDGLLHDMFTGIIDTAAWPYAQC